MLRPAGRIDQGSGRRVDAKIVINRGDDFLHVDRPFFGEFAKAIGGPDGLPHPHAAAGQG